MKAAMIALMVGLLVLTASCTTQPEPAQPVPFPADEATDNVAAAPATGNVYQVVINDNTFMPDSLEVGVGDTVEWTNVDNVQMDDAQDNTQTEGVDHTVSFDDAQFDEFVQAGTSVSYTFTEAGVFNYLCQFHPGMRGIVVVN